VQPEQTLRDRVKGKVTIDCVASGTPPILSEYEEAKVVKINNQSNINNSYYSIGLKVV
jgi:hypothetical protein